ncbi:MAG TPA: hypothetical protein PKI45_07260 [Candidatus Omnitrophota bacterium]|nr:hypothetical protein [Candidatus Omnitrophota bacterium]
MKLKHLINITVLSGIVLFLSGCALMRYDVIPQTNKGPHGGQMMRIDQWCSPGYVEFLATPTAEDEQLFQIFSYDKNVNPRNIHYSSADVEIETPDGKTTYGTLWDTKPFFWNRGLGILEGKVKIKEKAFKIQTYLSHGNTGSATVVEFSYPYSSFKDSPKAEL